MATTTITINDATNPTYGGCIGFDGVSSYARKTLGEANAQVSYDGDTIINRTFAFFDLSTDPTGGGTITKVELLATVNSVSGTSNYRIIGGRNIAIGLGNPPTGGSDADIYNNIKDFGDVFIADIPASAGAVVNDLGSTGLSAVTYAIGSNDWVDIEIILENEAAAGSVVFDAATGFGLRITYTPSAMTGAAMMLGVGQ